MYSALNFVGIIFENPKIDASQMTDLHLDVYAPAGTTFRVKLVSFPPDLAVGVGTGDLILNSSTILPSTPDPGHHWRSLWRILSFPRIGIGDKLGRWYSAPLTPSWCSWTTCIGTSDADDERSLSMKEPPGWKRS